MVKVSYVYPNTSGIKQRGGLLERWKLAKELGCTYIEIPADFIKNKTEIRKTGLKLGDFLNEFAIQTLYKKDGRVPEELKYILHTEPSLPRKDGYGISYQPPLKWYDKEWVSKFTRMIISISKFVGIPPSVVEIHPGDKRNSYKEILDSIVLLLNEYNDSFGVEPLILIENRTGQFISSGKDINNFWEFLSVNYSDLKKKIGIILDIQQLYTVTKKNFQREFKKIPLEVIRGFHIHYRHRVPDLSNEIPWKLVFDTISDMRNNIIINPEIHHKNKVKDVIKFCEEMVHN